MLLETEMIALLVAAAFLSPAPLGKDDLVARMSTTGMAVALELPGSTVDEAVMKGLTRRMNDRGVYSGKLPDKKSTVKVVTAYGETKSSKEWRDRLLGDQLVGAGQFDVGPFACTEHNHDLEPPFAEIGWHAFMTAGDTVFDFTLFTLRSGDESPVKKADFERIVKGARFAVLRLGGWDEMPAAVLTRMQSAFAHEAEKGDTSGAAWLAGECAKGDWACALAAEEVGLHEKMDAAKRLELCDSVIADLGKVSASGKTEEFALLTAQSGRALALRDAGKFDDALAAVTKARDAAGAYGAIAKSALAFDLATIHAGRKDAPAAVAALREAIAGNPDWRAYAIHESAFMPIGEDKALFALLRDSK
jgi:hypothetical protein